MTALVDRMAGWAVPRTAVRVPPASAEERILDWFDQLGIVVPEAEPTALHHGPKGFVEIPVDRADEDEDIIFVPDMPALAEVAAGCVSMVHEAERTFPSAWSWRRWTLTGKVARALYASGLTRSGGSWVFNGADPIGGVIYELPSLRDVMPRRHGTMRPYLLWRPSWWWECHARQGLRIRGRHRPERPYALGICAACCPCPYCGSHQECQDDCEVWR